MDTCIRGIEWVKRKSEYITPRMRALLYDVLERIETEGFTQWEAKGFAAILTSTVDLAESQCNSSKRFVVPLEITDPLEDARQQCERV